ncbi:MAG: hypothetical protein Q7S63_00120 [bacterium]|nr:hypothetical protein [bacterium]
MCILLPVPELSVGFILFAIASIWILGIISIPIILREDWDGIKRNWAMFVFWLPVIIYAVGWTLRAIIWSLFDSFGWTVWKIALNFFDFLENRVRSRR